jgi:WhiB family redox-sensing transcriptional regulator
VISREEIPEWMSRGICAQVGGDEWFPEKGGTTKRAKLICSRCPVQAECLQYALDEDIDWGVWGGASREERQFMRRERRTAA